MDATTDLEHLSRQLEELAVVDPAAGNAMDNATDNATDNASDNAAADPADSNTEE